MIKNLYVDMYKFLNPVRNKKMQFKNWQRIDQKFHKIVGTISK